MLYLVITGVHMAKILSFEVADDLYERIVKQQKRANVPYLSQFLRALVEDSLTTLETTEEKDNG
jgi:hypothetical protein